ncbi:MAG: SDR family NAD(P)-dependent oxidoreductase [Novosphingobium sp.]|nr:SDR family NAD(P)-dependent oxidoreductase [Novosphingobium sp.]
MNGTDIRFDGRAIVVTGAGRGLGRAQALMLAGRGAKVVVADNGSAMDGDKASAGPAAETVAEIEASGGEAVACTADLSTEAGAGDAVQAALDSFGRIDGVCHYASSCPDLKGPGDLPSRDVELVLRVNAFAAIWMARAAWQHMTKQKHGRFVFTPSGAIYGAMGNVPYATAKSAYLGLVRTLALEGKEHGIRANAVMPSARTRMTDGFQPGAYADWFFGTMTPEKVAATSSYLLSDECAANGEIFAVGGGRVARVMIAEAAGSLGCETMEAVRDSMSAILADKDYAFPMDLGERSRFVTAQFGVDAGLDAGSSYIVKPHDAD